MEGLDDFGEQLDEARRRVELTALLALGAGELRAALRNPADIRKALILGEILGRPRGA